MNKIPAFAGMTNWLGVKRVTLSLVEGRARRRCLSLRLGSD